MASWHFNSPRRHSIDLIFDNIQIYYNRLYYHEGFVPKRQSDCAEFLHPVLVFVQVVLADGFVDIF